MKREYRRNPEFMICDHGFTSDILQRKRSSVGFPAPYYKYIAEEMDEGIAVLAGAAVGSVISLIVYFACHKGRRKGHLEEEQRLGESPLLSISVTVDEDTFPHERAQSWETGSFPSDSLFLEKDEYNLSSIDNPLGVDLTGSIYYDCRSDPSSPI